MTIVQLQALFLNLIVYIIMLIPTILISLNKKIHKLKKNFFTGIIFCTFIEIFLSIILYTFSKDIFSMLTHKSGIINYAIYSSRILFASSSLFALKVFSLSHLYYKKKYKKIAILISLKIAITIILMFVLYKILNTKGILLSVLICDFLFYIIYLLNIIR